MSDPMNLSLRKFISFLLFSLLVPSLAGATTLISGKATEVSISLVDGIAVSPKGDIFISMRDHNIIARIDPKGMIHPYAGNGESGYSGDGGPALKAQLRMPAGLHYDKQGNLYIADRENHRVRKVSPDGTITTVAGTGEAGFSGDGGPAVQARLNLPSGVTTDSKGNLYISDRSNDRIRVVDPQGIIRTFAGNGKDGYDGDNKPALKASLDKPFGIETDAKDNLYIADRGNNRIRKVSPAGIITTVAGDGGFYFIGDNGPAYRASIAHPTDIALDPQGNLYIADRNNNRIRMVDTLGMIRTVVGTGQQDYNGDSEVARETNLNKPFAIALDPEGHLLIVDRSHYRIRRVDPMGSQVETIAGNGEKLFGGDGGPATGARLSFPHGIDVDSKDNIIFADKGNYRIRKISPNGIIQTIVGDGVRGNIGDGGPALEASVFPTVLALNDQDEIFFVSPSGFISLIRKVDRNGIIDLYFSTADREYQKDIVTAENAGLSSTQELAVITHFSDILPDNQGNLYIADRINHQVRMLDKNRKIHNIAGTGEAGYSGDGGPAIKASFRDPRVVLLDKEGNLYVGDGANSVIRKIDTKGIITTIAGNARFEDSGDGGPALEAGIRSIDDMAFSPDGELYILETGSHVIRKIKKDGTIVRVAGRPGIQGYFGDGGPATRAMLKQPACMAFDSKGNLYITDMGNNRIRKVDTNGIITTFAGNGVFGWESEGENVQIYVQNFP